MNKWLEAPGQGSDGRGEMDRGGSEKATGKGTEGVEESEEALAALFLARGSPGPCCLLWGFLEHLEAGDHLETFRRLPTVATMKLESTILWKPGP